jgi:hypothetical protein
MRTYRITVACIFVLFVNFVNAQNENLIRDIEKYISETDSLIKHCRNCFNEFHDHIISTISESGGTEYFYSKKYNGMSYFELFDSIVQNTSGDKSKEFWNEVEKKTEAKSPTILVWYSYFETDTITGIRKDCNSKKYYQNNELLAIIYECFENKTNIEIVDGVTRYFPIGREMGFLKEGKITLYINDNEIFYFEKNGKIEDDIESMARKYKLKIRP